MEAVREEEVKLQGVGFVKEVGFKPGVTGLSKSTAIRADGLSEHDLTGTNGAT